MGNSQRVYITVKSFSQRGNLLKRSDFQTLAESRDLDELMTRIKNTNYQEAVANVSKPYTSEKIEAALRVHLADLQYKITKAAGNDKVLDAYYMQFIIWNLKLILKGKVLGRSQEEIESSFNLRAAELIHTRDIMIKALVAKDLEETVSTLSSIEHGKEIETAVALYNEKKNIQLFDTYFDKMYYEKLGHAIRSSNDRDIIHIFGRDIDFYNILSIIRGKFWDLDDDQIQGLIVKPTSKTPKDVIERMMAAESVKYALNELSTTTYKDLIPDTENELDAISEFERNFEMKIYKSINGAFAKMFSMGTVVGISKLIAYEIRNIAAISFAVEQKISPDVTVSKLIVEEEE